MAKVVSFDVVGTLVDFHYEDYVWKRVIPQLYARKKGVSWGEAEDYVLSEYHRISIKDIRWFLPEYWFRHLNLDEDPMAVFTSHADKVRFYPEVPSVLESLSQKYDLIIASGATRNIIEIMIKKFRHHFKHIYSPVTDCQVVKKTPQFYEMICRSLKVAPYDFVHVGDEWYPDFIHPRSVGIKSIYLDRTGEKTGRLVVKDLKNLEDLFQFL
jgi:putative hydrolase of the HAD superfamily